MGRKKESVKYKYMYNKEQMANTLSEWTSNVAMLSLFRIVHSLTSPSEPLSRGIYEW